MSHPNQPEYFTLSSICEYDGTSTTLGIYENIDAVMYRLKRCYTSCGDQFRIECFHLGTKEGERELYTEQTVKRVKYKKEEEEKEAKLKEYELLKNGGDDNEV
jgi:hypothetical protein